MTDGHVIDPSDKATEPGSKRHRQKLIDEALVRYRVPPVVKGTNDDAQIHADQLLEDLYLRWTRSVGQN